MQHEISAQAYFSHYIHISYNKLYAGSLTTVVETCTLGKIQCTSTIIPYFFFNLWNPKEQAPTSTWLSCSWQQHISNRGRKVARLTHQENLKCSRQDSVLRSTPQILAPALCPFLTPVSDATKKLLGTCRGRALLDHTNLRAGFCTKGFLDWFPQFST